MSYDASIISTQENDKQYEFEVSIDSQTYKVTVGKDYYQQLTDGKITPMQLVERSFEFLLEREGPASILSEFDLPLIGHYFPEYEDVMRAKGHFL